MRTEKIETCPKCKTQFLCKPENCWCNDLPKIMPVNVNETCLCKECLQALIDEKTGMVSKTK